MFRATTGNVGIGITNPASKLDIAGALSLSGKPVYTWIDLATPVTYQFQYVNFSGQTTETLPASISTSARAVLADVYISCSYADHFIICFGREALTAQKTWTDTRAANPSTSFGNLARHATNIMYDGDSSGYSSYYGLWYPSVIIPVSGRTMYTQNYGNNGNTNGYLYFKIKAYAL
jgi:hypothetical protein